MASTGLHGSYPLTEKSIDQIVTKTSPGTYALGRRKSDQFFVDYTGRSDTNVAARLKRHIGKYPRFKFGYFPSAKAAFHKECRIYHDFKPKDNVNHPDRPNGTNWECPVCTIFD